MDKRTIAALGLILVLYLIFDTFLWKPQRVAMHEAQQQATANAVVDSTITPPPPTEAAEPMDSATLSDWESPQMEAETIILENDFVTVELNSKGAAISKIELKKYRFDNERLVNLVPENSEIAQLGLYQDGGLQRLENLVFSSEILEAGRSVRFYLGEESSEKFQKTFSLDDNYGILINAKSLLPAQGLRLDLDAGIADSESEKNVRNKNQDYRFFLNADNSIQKTPLSKLRKNQPQGSFGSFAWLAVRSKYFTLAVKEIEPALSKSYQCLINPDTNNPGFSLDSYSKDAKANWEQSYLLYAGPADAEILKGYGKQMENIAERGANWLRWLANFFAWFLKLLHRYVRNYGVVLIFVGLVLMVVLHPLTHKSMTANMKMQQIQPQVQALQSKYKNDPQAMQTELSKLYKEAGANPMSGCLPLLLQMPIFISLYNVLRYSLDMRNSGFMLWIKDLSEPDPYLILPIIMAAFMVIQSLMMQPKTSDVAEMDEKQKAAQSSQKMMTWMMPIMMFFIFRNMPAGLVLYWTTFNIFSVIQQYYLKKSYKNKE